MSYKNNSYSMYNNYRSPNTSKQLNSPSDTFEYRIPRKQLNSPGIKYESFSENSYNSYNYDASKYKKYKPL